MRMNCVFVCATVVLSSLLGRAQSGSQVLKEGAVQIQSEINRQQVRENFLRARLEVQGLSMEEKLQIVSEINRLELQQNLLRARLATGGFSQDQVNISSPAVDASQNDMSAAMRNMDDQARQFVDKLNNRPGRPEFCSACDCEKANPERAFVLYQKSATLGWAPAYYALALCYYNGSGTERDPKIGAEWLIKAANSGNEQAQMALGIAYKNGNGVEQSDELAAQWAQRSQQTSAAKQMLMGQIMNDNNNMSSSSSSSGTSDQILRSKIEREQRSLRDTESRLDQAARSGGSTTALSGTAEAQRRLIQSYQNRLSQ